MRSCCFSVLKVQMGLTRLQDDGPKTAGGSTWASILPLLSRGSLNSLTAASSPLTLVHFITIRRRDGLFFRLTGWDWSTCGGQHSLPCLRSLTPSTFLQVSFAWLLGFLAKIKRQVSACEVTFVDFGDYYLSICGSLFCLPQEWSVLSLVSAPRRLLL